MKTIMITLAAALALAGTLAAQDTVPVGPRERPPTIELRDPPVPVTPPQDGRQVAVLEIRFEFYQGRVRSAQVVESRRIASIAPKVFLRQGGDWEVRINGSEEDAFYVFNPAYLEAETTENARNPYTYVPQDGVVDWTLVVPLYRDGRSIELESIVIVDRATGDVVLEADLQQ